MKKVLRFLTLAVLLAAPWGGYFNQVQAQSTLTVADGTATNGLVPIYDYYADVDQHNQIIYPASLLSDMAGGTITNLSFYASGSGEDGMDLTVTIRLGEVDVTTLSSLLSPTLTTVWTGSIDNVADLANLSLSSSYVYQGENLLIDIQTVSAGEYASENTLFLGVTQASANAYSSAGYWGDPTTVSFLPKTTFTYTPGAPVTCLKPTALAAGSVTATGATLSWTAGGTETAWTVEYGTASDFAGATTQNVSTTTLNLTGLTANTTYYVRVKAVCGVGDESSWTSSSFYTGYCTPAPTSVDGSGITNVTFGTGGNIVNNSTRPTTSPYYGDYSAQIGAAAASTVASVDITFATGYTYGTLIWVDWNNDLTFGDNEIVYMGTSASTNPTTLSASFTVPADQPTGDYRMRIGAADSYFDSYISNPSGSGAHDPCGTGTYKVFHDYTLRVTEAPSCMNPTALAASAVTATSATLGWTASGTETAWTVEYGSAADFAGAASQNVATTPTLALTGLTPATTYYVRVKAVCSGSDESDWSTPTTFATECAAIAAVGYTQNFDALTAGDNVLPLCWSYINTTTYSYYQGYPKAYADGYSTYSQSAPNCLYFYTYNSSYYDPQPQYAILPEMTGLAGKQVTLSAKGYSSGNTFKIGTMSDPADASTFTLIAEQALTTSYQEFAYLVPSTTDAYLAIMMDPSSNSSGSSVGFYIDDISIAEPPTCAKPTSLMLETPSSRTAHTATLTWTNGDAETDWQIVYSTESTFDPNGATPVDVTTKPYTLTGLNASATYYAYVRANCGGGDYSAWCTTKATFTTTNGIGTPTGLAVDNATLSHNTATVTWSRVATNDLHESFDIYLSTDGTAPTAETVPTYTGITAMTYTFTGLTEATTYYVWVRDVCGTDGNSAWSSRVTINTTVFCPAPTSVTVSSATAHGATISWTGTSDSYNVYVGKATTTLEDATYDFEDNAISPNFTNDPTYAWTVTTADKHAGTYAVKSAGGFSSTQSDLTLTVEVGDGATITFWDKASSESNYDYGRFLVDGEQKHQTSGTSNSWTERTYPLTAGSHTLVWRFYKDVSGNNGNDCYYVDDITITNLQTVDVASWERYEADASPYVLFDDGNIEATTDYAVKVVGVCESTESHYESATVLFTTSADCGASNAVVSNIDYHSADVAWDGSSDAGYMVMLGYEDGIANDFVDEDFAGGVPTSAEWTNDATYPWTAVDGYIKSGNAGQSSKTSQISVTVDMDAAGYIEFDAECRGEGTGTSYYDKCIFSIDGSDQFTYGAQRTSDGFVHYSFPVAAGTHTFVWKYSKDSSVDPDGDYMAIDNLHIYTTNITWDEVEVVDVNNYTFDGLEDGTQYFVKISPECDRTIESNAAEFTTLALPTFNVKANNWYALSTPMHDAGRTDLAVGNVQYLTSGTYDFLRYDEPSSTWESQKSGAGHTGFDKLEAGRGYIYRRANDAVLKVDGEPNTGNVNVAITKDVNGWNLIGNPYLTTIRLNSTYIAPASTAALIDGGYKLNTNGTWTAIYSYTDIVAGQAVLVKASTAGTLVLRPTASKSASADEQESARGFVFSVSNAEYSDVAYALFADGEGLPKIAHLNPEAPMLSIDGYAIAKLDVNAERFPMSFNGQGKYTLALKENSTATGYLHLIDRATGRDIDLLTTPEYSFVGTGMADRFEVRLMPGMDENGNVNFVYIDGTRLIVDGEGELQVFDVMGRQLGSAQVSGTTTLDRSSLGIVNAGVYVLRLDGNTQKIVVK